MSKLQKLTITANKTVLVTLTVLLAGLFAVATSNAQSKDNSSGNNGTVKIVQNISDAPSNNPHVFCEFYVVGTKLDKNQKGYIKIEGQSPTKDAGVFTKNYIANEKGDFVVAFNLKNFLKGEPHPNQGYHLKLDVEGVKGNDKHKVFWVTCAKSVEPTKKIESTPTVQSTPLQTTSTPTGEVLGIISLPKTSNGNVAEKIAGMVVVTLALAGAAYSIKRRFV